MLELSLLAFIAPGASQAAELPAGWSAVTGDGWGKTVDFHTMLIQRGRAGSAAAVNGEVRGPGGAWRCFVQPSLGAKACGVWFHANQDLTAGFRCELGGNPGVGGFALKDAGGEVLWEDKWAPWSFYDAYVLEGVAEKGRVRVQMFGYDGQTLISQSDWVEVPAERTEGEGTLGAYTEDAIARFWSPEHSATPLSPITDDAPNKRRLVQGEDSDWALFGTGNWMWTDKNKVRVRQYADTERAWALNRSIRGANRVWRTFVRVHPPAGGAGLIFQADEKSEGGFNCWLGGTYGAGCLMLYRNGGPDKGGEALWASPQDKWHYDEDLLLQAETQDGKVRVQLLAGDATTVIAESPWIDKAPDEAAREGHLGFHTWKGSAEFWGFSEEAQPEPAQQLAGTESPLGPAWRVVDGDWKWATKSSLAQTGAADVASCIANQLTGAKGAWRCRVKLPEETKGAGLLFQVSPDLAEGFICLLGAGSIALYDLAQADAPRWESSEFEWEAGQEYVLEGLVQTDRVVARLLAADGKTVLDESEAVWVSDKNNDRMGHLGLTTRGGPAEFTGWSFEPER